jgi:hypothetical protein
MTLDIKMQKKWKYSDSICIGCGIRDKTGEELISCSGYGDYNDDLGSKPMIYSIFYYGTTVGKNDDDKNECEGKHQRKIT